VQRTEWTYPSSQTGPEPVVSINSKQPTTSKSWKYAVVYVAGTTSKSGGAEYATWDEIAYVPKTAPGSTGQQPKFNFVNYGSQTIYVTSSGGVFDLPVPTDAERLKTPICKENQVLLGELQEVDYPPPTYSALRSFRCDIRRTRCLNPPNAALAGAVPARFLAGTLLSQR
jgi:hypothetical protein